MTSKLYCYVDESGQDTHGAFFAVGVVVVGPERDECRQVCEELEASVGKSSKWHKTAAAVRVAYVEQLLTAAPLRGKLYYAVYGGREYQALRVKTIAQALDAATAGVGVGKATVLIDALSDKEKSAVSNALHRYGVRTRKVRGVRRDEYDPLIGLADALCGWVRAAVMSGQESAHGRLRKLLAAGLEREIVHDLSG